MFNYVTKRKFVYTRMYSILANIISYIIQLNTRCDHLMLILHQIHTRQIDYIYTNRFNIYTSLVYILKCIPEKDCHINVDGLFYIGTVFAY